jgi:acetyl-CoA/propionyl-CoA carboxylase biotin carboxyl carrier protein
MYFVKLQNGAEIAVQLVQTDRGRWRATTADGNSVDLEVKGRGADGAFVLVVDGVQRTFHVDPRDGSLSLIEDDVSHDVEVVHAADLVLERAAQSETSRSGAEMLTSPITGIVLQMPVKTGASVAEGDIVVVVEAMKMENSLGAPRSGTVVEVFAQPGQTVFVGDPLVQIQ